MQKIFKPIPISPKICILGLYPENLSLKSHKIKLIDLCLVHSKHLIALYWKNILSPYQSLAKGIIIMSGF